MRTAILLMPAVPAGANNQMLSTGFEVNASIEKAWTTPDRIRTFFAPDCKVELRVDGAYEIYFSPQAKPGERGREGMRILERIWRIRRQRTNGH